MEVCSYFWETTAQASSAQMQEDGAKKPLENEIQRIQ